MKPGQGRISCQPIMRCTHLMLRGLRNMSVIMILWIWDQTNILLMHGCGKLLKESMILNIPFMSLNMRILWEMQEEI